jgi:hypothetical protein
MLLAARGHMGGDMNERVPSVDPFLRLTIGVPVYTDDEQKIGTVKDKQGRHFRVGTGLFQKDFWLPADCVESAVAGQPVMLPFSKDQLDQYKLGSAPEAAA